MQTTIYMHEFLPPTESLWAPGGDGGVPEAGQDQPERQKQADPGLHQTRGPAQPHSHPAEDLSAGRRLWLQVREYSRGEHSGVEDGIIQ